MTTVSDRPTAHPSTETPRLRVVLLLDVLDGHQERFLAAYEQIRHQVAGVPGHVSDQLCQSLGNAAQWLITSEWESAEPFLSWVESAEHRKMVEPLHGCVRDTRSLRFVIARETPEPGAAVQAGGQAAVRVRGLDPIPAPPLSSGGIVRHAITFTVKPGSEQAVARILADYRSPRARVDDTTRLCRTSLFLRGNRVVRAVEVTGDLGNALRHVAAQPEVRAVEEAVNPYLEEARDLTDPSSARAFFARAALPAAHHSACPVDPAEQLTRRAFLYPVRPGLGEAAAKLFAALDGQAVADPAQPLVSSTVFHRDDLLVRLVDLRGPDPDPDRSIGATAELARLLDLGADGHGGDGGDDFTGHPTESQVQSFLAGCAMDLITDRQAQEESES